MNPEKKKRLETMKKLCNTVLNLMYPEGALVKHRYRPELGIGIVLWANTEGIAIKFENRDETVVYNTDNIERIECPIRKIDKLSNGIDIQKGESDMPTEPNELYSREEVYGQLHEMLEWLDLDRMRTMIENTDFKGVSLNEAIAVGRIMNAIDALYDGLSMLDRARTD